MIAFEIAIYVFLWFHKMYFSDFLTRISLILLSVGCFWGGTSGNTEWILLPRPCHWLQQWRKQAEAHWYLLPTDSQNNWVSLISVCCIFAWYILLKKSMWQGGGKRVGWCLIGVAWLTLHLLHEDLLLLWHRKLLKFYKVQNWPKQKVFRIDFFH